MAAQIPFVGAGRHTIVEQLVSAFDNIESGSSAWFHLEAPTGSGKTRIIQEFYRVIAADRQHNPAYWPASIVDDCANDSTAPLGTSFEATRKQVHPRAFVKPAGAVPNWLWWGFGCGDRHGVRLSSLAHDVGQLEEHGPHLVDALNKGSRLARSLRLRTGEISESVMSEAAGVALDAAGAAIPGLGLLALLGKYSYSSIRSAKEKRQRSEEHLLDVVADHSGAITDAIEIIELLGRSDVPTVLVVEDLHWADEYLAELITRVLRSRDTRALVVTTSWPGHVDDSGATASALFREHNARRLTFATDDGDALEPLTVEDRTVLVSAVMPNISQPVARMVAKQVSNPLAIQLIGSLRSIRVRLEDEHEAREAVQELPSEISDLYRQAWEELDNGVQLGLGLASLAMPSSMQPRTGLRDDRWNKLHISDKVLSEMEVLIRELTGRDTLDADSGVGFGWSEELDRRLRQFTDPAQAELAKGYVLKQLSKAERAAFQRRIATEVVRIGLPTELQSAQDEHSVRLHLSAVTAGMIDAAPQTYGAGARLLWKLFRSLGEQPEVEDLAHLLNDLAVQAQGPAEHLQALTQFVLLQCAYARGESEAVERELPAAHDLAQSSDARIQIGLGRLHGRVIRSLGQLEPAANVFGYWLTVSEERFPPGDEDCVTLRNELAFTLGRMGRPHAAAQILRSLPQTTPGSAPELAEPHAQLRRDHDYASLLRRQGRPSAALNILGNVLERQRALLGSAHPDTLATLQLIGAAQRDSGKIRLARSTIDEVLSARIETLGFLHHDTLVARGHLVWLLRRRREWEQALTVAQELLTDRVRLFGPRHNTVADASRVYGTLLMETGQFRDAEAVLLSALEPSARAAAEDPSAIDTLTYLGRLRRYECRFAEATECLELAGHAGHEFEAGHLSLQAIELEHCRLLSVTGQVDPAIRRLKALELLQKKVLDARHPELARTQAVLGAVHRLSGSGDANLWIERARSTADGTDPEHEIWSFIADPHLLLSGPDPA